MNLDTNLIEWITGRVLDGLVRPDGVRPPALTLLLRRFGATRRGDLRDALELTLDWATSALPRLECSDDRAGWLTVFAEAAAMSDSPALRDATGVLVRRLRGEWRAATRVDDSMRSIAACLAAVNVCDSPQLVPDAIDELERIVGMAYQPGEGMAEAIGAPVFARGDLSGQMCAAGALLTAHALTGRLPYSMLAEELVQSARRAWWDAEHGGFSPTALFAPNCEAALVLCRLTALHRDEEYRDAAVVAVDADYAADAERTLVAQASALADRGEDAALFGLALDEFLRL